MPRSFSCVLAALAVLAGPAASAFEIRATIKGVDPERRTVHFTAGDQERTVKVDPEAKLLDEQGEMLAAGLKAVALKPGAVVVLTVERVENQPLIRGIRLGGSVTRPAQ